MPDYTEEDVERVARELARADGKVWNTDADGYVELQNAGSVYVGHIWHRYMPMADAALKVIHPLAYTAGALAMKEAAAEYFMKLANQSKPTTARAERWRQAAYNVRALPVPPRGSKI